MSDLIKRGQALKCAEHDTETYYALSCLPGVDAIPVEFIKSEAQRVNAMIESASEEGKIEEADRLSTIMATLDAVVSNWIYTTGEEWRKKNETKSR